MSRVDTPASPVGDDLRLSEQPQSTDVPANLKSEHLVSSTSELLHEIELWAALRAARGRERDLAAQVVALQSELSMRPQVEDLARITASWTNAKENAEHIQQRLNAECATLRERVSKLNRDLALAQDRAQRAESQAQMLAPLLDEARVRLRQKCEHSENLEREVESLRQTIDSSAKQVSLLTSRAESAESRVAQLSVDCKGYQSRAEILETALHARNKAALENEAVLRREIGTLQMEARKIPALEEALAQLRIQAQRVPGLESALAQCDAQATAAERYAQQLEHERVTLRQNLDYSVMQFTAARNRAEVVQGHLMQSQGEVVALRAHLKSAELAQEGLVARAEVAESRAQSLEADCNDLRERVGNAEADYTDLLDKFQTVEGYMIQGDARRTELEEGLLVSREAVAKARVEQPMETDEEEHLKSGGEPLLAGLLELLPPSTVSDPSSASEVLHAVRTGFEGLRKRTTDVEEELRSLQTRSDARASRYAMLQARVAQSERCSWRY